VSTLLPTSSVYGAAWRSLNSLLLSLSWPKVSNSKSFVFGCTFGTGHPPAECVLILTAAEPDPTNQAWGPIGNYERDETFIVKMTVLTSKQHKTWLDALNRLEELTSVIEQAVHEAGKIQNRADMIPELAPVMKSWEVTRVLPEIYPDASNGFAGMATVYVLVNARIRPTNTIR
jgi:hypothetical protein